MRPSLKTILLESHVAIVTIAILLAECLIRLFQLVWVPTRQILDILIDAVEYPYVRHAFGGILNSDLIWMVLFDALPFLAAAWSLSFWVFGVGPIKALATYQATARSQYV